MERETIKTSGKEVHELFDTVYADVVQGKKSDEAISVETTFSELCNKPEKSLGAEPVESSTLEKLTEAKRNLPEQKTQELQKKVNAASDTPPGKVKVHASHCLGKCRGQNEAYKLHC